MAVCNICNINVASCWCWWKADKCPCWFTEAQISITNRQLMKQQYVVKVKEQDIKPVHKFEWMWKRDKCIYCLNSKFYCTNDICPELIKLTNQSTDNK